MLSAQELASKAIDFLESGFDFRLPDLTKDSEKEALQDEVLNLRAQLSAHDASDFFHLPTTPIQEGDSIGVYINDVNASFDDVLEYNIDEFKELGCTSMEDMTKIWAHECGHRILQNLNLSPWASELGADFFAGVRSEMKRVTWPSRSDIVRWTLVVIVALTFFGVLFAVLDNWVVSPIMIAVSGLGA